MSAAADAHWRAALVALEAAAVVDADARRVALEHALAAYARESEERIVASRSALATSHATGATEDSHRAHEASKMVSRVETDLHACRTWLANPTGPIGGGPLAADAPRPPPEAS